MVPCNNIISNPHVVLGIGTGEESTTRYTDNSFSSVPGLDVLEQTYALRRVQDTLLGVKGPWVKGHWMVQICTYLYLGQVCGCGG